MLPLLVRASTISLSQSADYLRHVFGSSPIEVLLSVVILGVAACFIWYFIVSPTRAVLSNIFNFQRLQNTKMIIIKVVPPIISDKSPLTTEQFFAILQSILTRDTHSFADSVVSLEIASSRSEGIGYLIHIHEHNAESLQRQIASYLPDARMSLCVEDFGPKNSSTLLHTNLMILKQNRHYAFPLQSHENLIHSDPIAFITGAMTKLEDEETMVVQMILVPHYSRAANRLHSKIIHTGYVALDNTTHDFIKSRWLIWLIAALLSITLSPLDGLGFVIFGLVVSVFLPNRARIDLSAQERHIYEKVLGKISQPLFRVNIRVLIVANTQLRQEELSKGVNGSFNIFWVPGFQRLVIQNKYLGKFLCKFQLFEFRHRLPSLLNINSSIFAASEVASIYHFPYDESVKTENLAKSLSKTLPAPVSLKNKTKLDVMLGSNKHHGIVTPIGLTSSERERHMYIIGGTGNGKTTLLQYAIVQDILSGKGVAVIDPHGDMAEALLRYIPKGRINDVIYFNPDDIGYPIGLNLLELSSNLNGDDLLRQKDLVTESVVSIFRKIFSDDDTGGHRVEYILRNTVQTALTVENATLFTVYDLLNDPSYRRSIVNKLDNKDLQNFWKNEFGRAGGFQQVKMAAGITAKIGRFLFSASAKRILEQPKSTIDFSKILDGKILICNLSKGLLGEDTSELFGIAILAKLQIAALQRVRQRELERRSFYLYVDEFQNFATQSFVQMLSEARKYKLFLTMAEQSTSQQSDPRMVNTILANVGTLICFRSGNPSDEQLVLPFFKPFIAEGEIASLPSYSFYMRISAIAPQEPFSGETVLLEQEDNVGGVKKIIAASRANYSTKFKTKPISDKAADFNPPNKIVHKVPSR